MRVMFASAATLPLLALILSAPKPFESTVDRTDPARMLVKLKRDPLALASAPDGKTFAVGTGSWVALMGFEDGAKRWATEPDRGYVRGLAFSPDGQRLAVAAIGGVFMLDAGTGKVQWKAAGHPNSMRPPPGLSHAPEADAYSVAFTPDGAEVWSVSANGDRKIRRWAASDGSSRGEIDTVSGTLHQIAAGAGALYVAGHGFGLAAYEPNGALRWHKKNVSVSDVFAIAGDHLLVGGTRGGAVVHKVAQATGEPATMIAGLGSGVPQGLALVGDRLLAAVERVGVNITRAGGPGEPATVTSAIDAKVRINPDAVPALVLGLGGKVVAVATREDAVAIYRVP